MPSFDLQREKQSQLDTFLNSRVFRTRSLDAYSDYWIDQSSLFQISSEQDGKIKISGDSGFYIPESKAERIRRIIKRYLNNPLTILAKFKSIFNSWHSRPLYMSAEQAFDATMNHDPISDPDLSKFRVNHLNLKRNYRDVLPTSKHIENYFSTYSKRKLNPQLIVLYYLRNLLIPQLSNNKENIFLEIGSGNGNLPELLIRQYSPKIFFIVDLPESIVNAFIYLSDTYLNAEIALPNIVREKQELKGVTAKPFNKETKIISLTP